MLDEVKDATNLYKEISQLYKEVSVGLLHGKMKASEKDEIMKDFKDGKIMMLVSTTVIEVGIDIPEATIMVIMNAERFGISQLHQLRGRVGRSDLQSYCFLETKKKHGESYQRLQYLEKTTDGFKLAEFDLNMRGPGEVYGIKQAGIPELKFAKLSDLELIKKTKEASEILFNQS